MPLLPVVGVAALGFVLGARHGLDWDHLTAVADLVGGADQRGRRPLGLAFFYCAGHGLVIVLLGAMVGVLGVHLPGALDRVFEVVVGTTLVLLGLLVLWQIWQQRSSYQYTSRWRLLLSLLQRVWLRHKGVKDWDRPASLSKKTAFSIGVLHGTGAETPTQVTLFVSAAAAGSSGEAALVMLAFVAGLVVSDLAVAVLWLGGRMGSLRLPRLQLAFGLFTGAGSLLVGLAFIGARSAALPSLLGG
jgi:high-affinity nickel-transport protein